MEASEYGFGENPPYSLYQADDGKWGLIDGSGKRLKAVFERHGENRFSHVFYEMVSFDEREGFVLVSWYDPSEVWFNFDDPAYPEEFGRYMWRPLNKTIHDYREELYALMPEDRHWLLDEIFDCEGLKKMEDEEFRLAVDSMLFFSS